MAAPHILIATPAYGANVKIQYMESIMRTTQAFQRRGLKYDFRGTVNAEVVAARNFLASVMYERAHYTHLLFVDADMAFAPTSVEKLLDAAKPLIGCIYPKKRLNLTAYARAAREQPDDGVALASAFNFVVRHPAGTKSVQVANGMCRVLGVGMGLTLIERQVFAGLLATGKIASNAKHELGPDGLEGPLFGFFDPLQSDGSQYVSEDFSFCERWVKLCGGEVIALASEEISHIGDFTYTASYLDRLKAGQQ
jgi:hypothetical protein